MFITDVNLVLYIVNFALKQSKATYLVMVCYCIRFIGQVQGFRLILIENLLHNYSNHVSLLGILFHKSAL